MLCLAVAEEPRQRLAPRRRAASADDHCLEICAFASGGATCLEALPFQDEGCPSDAHIVDMPDCSGRLGLGDLCEADGECKTNKRIDNCEYVGLQCPSVVPTVRKRRASRRSLLFFVLLVMFVASVAGLVLCYLCLFCVGCFVAGGSRGKRGTDDVTGAFRDDVAAAQELPAVGAYEAPVASPLGEDRERSLERVAFATPILYEEL
ncbi:hypothetical protein JL722_9309 [Aureococcus anophagefferens]|nr:hypothetical protein JL722_9309 [Aureococcus anophagefferens]